MDMLDILIEYLAKCINPVRTICERLKTPFTLSRHFMIGISSGVEGTGVKQVQGLEYASVPTFQSRNLLFSSFKIPPQAGGLQCSAFLAKNSFLGI